MTEASRVRTDLFQVRHTTRYHYSRPVAFGQHRGMFRPIDSPDLRLLSIRFDTKPESAVHWVHDVFSNAVTVFDFMGESETLEVDCTFQVIRSAVDEPQFPIDEHARLYPFEYNPDQQVDLAPSIMSHYPDPDGTVQSFARRFTAQGGGETWKILENLNTAIHSEFDYQRREEHGVQPPAVTLAQRAGSCRDYAVLMCELARRLGFAARFVTGYLYDPSLDSDPAAKDKAILGAGATHAWVQIFVPGAGWIEFDPTNGGVASGALIKTGVARTASQAVPLAGSFGGSATDVAGMDVKVEVTRLVPTLTSGR
ncbi:transglutaminase [Marinicauda pacifica]|uniref:transglutaminase family protein n=1 Tax=Marinicauda TaxID=1649466 RepID=UPI001984EAA3|nr:MULTISPECIES: transglutaminase family protein [Marinicauda]GGE43657.1 transglutaminase [Marinicauda pacifica]